MTFSPQTVVDGQQVAALCAATGRSYSLVGLAKQMKWPTSRTRRALDWAIAERAVTKSPFQVLYENGTWTYGYRTRISEIIWNMKWDVRYLRTRTQSRALYLEHYLSSRSLAKVWTKK